MQYGGTFPLLGYRSINSMWPALIGPSPNSFACFSIAARTLSAFCTNATRSCQFGASRNFCSASRADFAAAGTLPIFRGTLGGGVEEARAGDGSEVVAGVGSGMVEGRLSVVGKVPSGTTEAVAEGDGATE